jgi:hypothetical protein
MTTSMQTRLAQGAARDAEGAWKQHRANCPACSRSFPHTGSCAAGCALRDEAQRLRSEARREADLDKAPNQDQETLF